MTKVSIHDLNKLSPQRADFLITFVDSFNLFNKYLNDLRKDNTSMLINTYFNGDYEWLKKYNLSGLKTSLGDRKRFFSLNKFHNLSDNYLHSLFRKPYNRISTIHSNILKIKKSLGEIKESFEKDFSQKDSSKKNKRSLSSFLLCSLYLNNFLDDYEAAISSLFSIYLVAYGDLLLLKQAVLNQDENSINTFLHNFIFSISLIGLSNEFVYKLLSKEEPIIYRVILDDYKEFQKFRKIKLDTGYTCNKLKPVFNDIRKALINLYKSIKNIKDLRIEPIYNLLKALLENIYVFFYEKKAHTYEDKKKREEEFKNIMDVWQKLVNLNEHILSNYLVLSYLDSFVEKMRDALEKLAKLGNNGKSSFGFDLHGFRDL